MEEQKKSHGACVKAVADDSRKEKWEVKADVEGGEKPSKIGAFTPDVEAHKAICGAFAKSSPRKISKATRNITLSSGIIVTSTISTCT